MGLCCHYVATGYIYDSQSDRFLLIYHRKLGKWLAPGGHLNEGEQPHAGALREVWEETGQRGRIVDLREGPRVGTRSVPQLPAPFCILYETIPANAKADEHRHIDFVYVLEVDPFGTLALDEHEVEQARWIASAEVEDLDTFENIKRVCQAISDCYQRRRVNANSSPSAVQAPRRG